MLFKVGSAISLEAKIGQKALAQERRTNRVRDLMLNSIISYDLNDLSFNTYDQNPFKYTGSTIDYSSSLLAIINNDENNLVKLF